ncbi:hypothetical protein SAMN05444280_1421 [Tangfeifania diversioriginum]|uniref:Beta-lactamase-inhibitor-like, PepSY-like n=1 Tax=Tangfeifania diversioriginum TaxID=1168035 RepID=A0A1M6NE59_9BACT|nr:hypothetical protein [Tangfeifania diversioriginum]SHJ93995.1 hypothetical protein SAMN05444280_1421 [Tangfeifania diversioriginum]
MKRGMMFSIVLMFLGMGMSTAVLADNASEPMVILQEEVTYEEIQKEDVPEAVLTAVKESYGGYELEKAFLGSDGNYKLKLIKGEQKVFAFFNSNGEVLKVETAEDGK